MATPLVRAPAGPGARERRRALPLPLVARFAGSFAAVAADWPDQPPDGGPSRTAVRVAHCGTHDVWLIRWPAGTRVRPHDHGGSVGAFSVVRGALEEVRFGAAGRRSRLLGAGSTVAVGSDVVHDVVSRSPDALSVHVYSPPLSEMAIYDEGASAVVERERVEGPDLEPEALT
jgi:hypothetical protein